MTAPMNAVDEDRELAGEYDPVSARGASTAPGGGHRQQPVDQTTRHLTWIACLIGAALVVLIGSWMLLGRQRGEVPVIEAAPGPVKVKPVDAGGMQLLGGAAPMFASPDGSESLAPPPEEARPDALQAQLDAARRSEAQSSAGQGAPAALGPPPQASKPQASKPQPLKLLPGMDAAPLDVPRQPAAAPSDAQLHTEATPALGRTLAVQLAALGSHQAAQSEWSRLCRNHPSLFSGRKPVVEQANHDGRAIYRLRTRGFTSLAAAHSFCMLARAQQVACTVADF